MRAHAVAHRNDERGAMVAGGRRS